MFQKATRFFSFGSRVEILYGQEGNPHHFSVDKGKSQGEKKDNELVHFKPEHLEGF